MSRELQRTVPVELPAPPAPALPPTPLARLPEAAGASDPYWRLVAAFLVGYPAHSSRAYLSDLKANGTRLARRSRRCWACAGAPRAFRRARVKIAAQSTFAA